MKNNNSRSKISKGQKLFQELSSITKSLSDEEVSELLGTGLLDDFLKSILDPKSKEKSQNLQQFLLENKNRATLLALIRLAINNNYSFRGINEIGATAYLSPYHLQWFDDGVMFLQGKKPFEGLIGCYRETNKVSYAIVTRDASKGEMLGPEHFEFIEEKEWIKRYAEFKENVKISTFEAPRVELEKLLATSCNDEAQYQQLLSKYPWSLGAEYKSIERHTKLDDKNIPDFTGQKVIDGTRDVIEVKPPFLPLFKKNGDFNSNFNDAWNQAERYLKFATDEKGYLLRKKGLKFENPLCRLIIGYNLSAEQHKMLLDKQSMNPLIRILTYDDLLQFIENTIALLGRVEE